jgi:hypothetical protein
MDGWMRIYLTTKRKVMALIESRMLDKNKNGRDVSL